MTDPQSRPGPGDPGPDEEADVQRELAKLLGQFQGTERPRFSPSHRIGDEPDYPADAAPPDDGPARRGGGPPAGASPLGAPLSGDAATVAAERDEYLAALQRVKADFDNYKKRVDRQYAAQSARAAMDLVTKLLPVLDTLDLAVSHLALDDRGEPGPDGTALVQTRAQLLDVLAKEGLERVDAPDVAFDPEIHDAVAQALPSELDPADAQASDDGGHVVHEVLRSGYRWRDQVVRPAMVRVRG